jgi:hypothetical protein
MAALGQGSAEPVSCGNVRWLCQCLALQAGKTIGVGRLGVGIVIESSEYQVRALCREPQRAGRIV